MRNRTPSQTVSIVLRLGMAAVVGLAALVLSSRAYGQVSSGSLSGIVYDASGAVIPGAQVVLKNEATSVLRNTVADGAGYFNFPAVQPGSYTVTISSQGFRAWEQRSITLNQGESRTVPNIMMQLATTSQEVTVVASAVAAAPIDTGESRQTLGSHMISQLSIQGRDAAELLKLMPGVGMNTGLNQASWNSLTTGTNSGPIGNFTANGTQPYGGLSMTMDGAAIVDPGNQGTQIANVNQDQTAEVTILNSAFGAEYAKGPVTFQAITKSGTSSFHGDAYIYGRNGSLNAEDSYLKNQGVPKPIDRYWYPGGDIGGPILIPGTNFNKDHNKAFFYAAFEYMNQHPEGSLRQSIVPTPEMLQGDFSQAVVSQLYGNSNVVPCGAYDPKTGAAVYPAHTDPCGTATNPGQIVNGMVPTSMFDPNSLVLAKLLPPPNVDPATHNGNNFAFLDNPPQNRWEFRIRGDYSFDENTKLYVAYGRQNEKDINNFGVWWWPGGTVPYPSQLPAQTIANDWSVNLVHVFSPTLTNETIFTYAYYINPVKLTNPSALNPSQLGFTAKGVFNPAVTPVVPNIVSWGCNSSGMQYGCFPDIYGPGFAQGFANGAFGKAARVPAILDNLTKVLGTHTLKAGFYWDSNGNQQTSGYGSWPQGMYEFDQWGSTSTGNPIADFLIGHAQSFAQVSADPVYNMKYHEVAFYGQDQWKLTRRFTLTYGVRVDHEGQWYPTNTPGLAVWNPATYNNSPGITGFPGLVWNAFGNVPVSGFTSRFIPDPRVGVAYDLFGNGRTVLRGGFGLYQYQFAYNDVSVATDPPLGITNFGTVALDSLGQAASFTPSPANGVNGNINALKMNDNRTPYTESWDFVVSQRMPWRSLFEVSYVGNRSRNMLIAGNGSGAAYLANINKIPMGALFGADPKTGITYLCTGTPSDTCVQGTPPSGALQDYRPYANYQTLDVDTHGSYANYNALVLSWQKQAGRITFLTNYAWSKTLGIRDGQTNNGNGNGNVIDTFNTANNYGVLAYDHTNIFNAGYVFALPGLTHQNSILKGIVNGWQLSGITHFESGAPIQPNTAGDLNVVWPSGVSNSIVTGGVGNQQILGTDSATLVPRLTCDPRSGLKSGQYFNPDCFAIPARGSNGAVVWPYIKGPGNFNSDLALYKDFRFKEHQDIQFRFSAFNFLNHPLPQFALGNDVNLNFGCPVASCQSLSQYANTNAHTSGFPMYTVGRRVIEFALKYQF